MKWIELSVEAHAEAVDAIANVFQEYGTGGVVIEQPIRSDDEGEEQPAFLGMPIIKAYLPLTPNGRELGGQIEEALWHLRAFQLSPMSELSRREVDEKDWENGWKDHFHPLKIGRVVIKPSWRQWKASPDETVVALDPGMAFGTGLHPTTQLTLLALQDRVKPEMHILDLGTGSGILAIAAARLGGRVTALDVSEVAVGVARENVTNNRVFEEVSVAQGSIDAVGDKQYDLILANLIANVLIDLAPQLAAALKRHGQLLASGIIEERAGAVQKAFAAAGLTTEQEQRDGDWWLFVARRRK